MQGIANPIKLFAYNNQTIVRNLKAQVSNCKFPITLLAKQPISRLGIVVRIRVSIDY